MVVASFIHCVEQLLLTGLLSLAIVFATIRAHLAKILGFMETAGFSPFFIISLFSILSVYVCIATIRCCALCQQVGSTDEEYGEDLVPSSRLMFPIFLGWRWDGQRLRLYLNRGGGVLRLSSLLTSH